MSSSSVQVGRALRNARLVLSAARTHRADVLEAAAVAWSIGSDTLSPIYDATVTTLDHAATALQAAEAARVEELADDAGPRQARDEADGALRATLIRIGSLLRLAFPTDLDLQVAPLPASGVQLLLDADNLIHRLGTADRTTELDLTGTSVSTARLADTLREDADRFREALNKVADEAQELASVLLARDRALTRFRSSYRSTGLVLEGFFRAADLPDLADRIRPTERRTTGHSAAAPEAPVEPPAE